MNGLGRVTKSAAQETLAALRGVVARQYAPEDYHRVQYIENEVLHYNYFFHILTKRNAVYIEVPKAASSYILRTLVSFEGRKIDRDANPHLRRNSGLDNPRGLGVRRFAELLRQPDLFVFTVVRNPYTRLVSCYLDKFADVPIGDGSYISEVVRQHAREFGGAVPDGRPLTFEEFVDFACRSGPLGRDGHWAPQARIVPHLSLAPQVVGRFETLPHDLAAILRRLGAGPALIEAASVAKSPAADIRARDMLTPALAARIAETYAADFSRFGYDTAPPA